ncbi:MAG: 4-(cytidine 5'-diphospho)-2-C-methyl-D-erythritol kinase [Planctomycetota bacterium]|jgi:4-diphosphocytidyl-2-C-methyl-D-erythritol kinase
MALALEAPAKINLSLQVLNRRADGYHEVKTILHALALHDDVVVELGGDGIDLSLGSAVASGLDVPVGGDNLVVRAARRFFERTGIDSGCRIHLTKRIPAGAGLGGGSADAATTLVLLNALTGDPLNRANLFRCASELGADVPFFIDAGTQTGIGRGDELTPHPKPPHLHLVLVFPPLGTSTAAVYEAWDKNHEARLTPQKGTASITRDKTLMHEEVAMPRGFRNDLESSAVQLHPELGEIRDRIARSGCGRGHLAGSGSTFFVAFSTSDECASALSRLGSLGCQGVTLLQTESASPERAAPRNVTFPVRGGSGSEGH